MSDKRPVKRQTSFTRFLSCIEVEHTDPISRNSNPEFERIKLEDELVFLGAGVSIGKSSGQNEDAFFTSVRGLGVSDGVGSWKTKYGFNSSDFSKELMEGCHRYIRALTNPIDSDKL